MFSEIATMAEDKKDKEDKEVAEKKDRAADVLQKLLGRSGSDSDASDSVGKFDQGKLCTICKVRSAPFSLQLL